MSSRASRLAAAHRKVVAASAFTLALASAGVARADVVDASKEDVTTLEQTLAAEHAALSTTDCTSACRALASIRRAADKICALDPTDRCAAARAKADDATRRVREACPDCAIASAPLPAPPRDEPAYAKKGADAPAPTTVEASAPPSESRRGGCAGCEATGAAPGDLAGAALVVAALVRVLRRRSNRTTTQKRPPR